MSLPKSDGVNGRYYLIHKLEFQENDELNGEYDFYRPVIRVRLV